MVTFFFKILEATFGIHRIDMPSVFLERPANRSLGKRNRCILVTSDRIYITDAFILQWSQYFLLAALFSSTILAMSSTLCHLGTILVKPWFLRPSFDIGLTFFLSFAEADTVAENGNPYSLNPAWSKFSIRGDIWDRCILEKVQAAIENRCSIFKDGLFFEGTCLNPTKIFYYGWALNLAMPCQGRTSQFFLMMNPAQALTGWVTTKVEQGCQEGVLKRVLSDPNSFKISLISILFTVCLCWFPATQNDSANYQNFWEKWLFQKKIKNIILSILN